MAKLQHLQLWLNEQAAVNLHPEEFGLGYEEKNARTGTVKVLRTRVSDLIYSSFNEKNSALSVRMLKTGGERKGRVVKMARAPDGYELELRFI